MRTKTLLLSAVALAAGIFASQAQSNVYSANIVGYVVTTNAVNTAIQLATPLDNGTNDIVSLLPGAPNGATVSIFSGGTLQTSTKNKGLWNHDYILPPGTGYFYTSPSAGTNTYVGQTGFTNGFSVTAGVTYLLGSPVPFSGVLSDTGTNTMNLNALPNGTTISVLTGGTLQASTKNKGLWPHNFTILPGQGFYLNSPVTTNVVQILSIQ